MYKATRQLISARNKYAHYLVEKVKVRNTGCGRKNDCLNNAANAIDMQKGTKLVSGWLVGAYNDFSDSTTIISHFWNIKDGLYFDTTPGISSAWEYVVDMDLAIYGQEKIDSLADLVCSSLLLRNGEFSLVGKQEGRARLLGKAQRLNCATLFENNRIKPGSDESRTSIESAQISAVEWWYGGDFENFFANLVDVNTSMLVDEIVSEQKPLTPEQSRVKALQRGVDNARQALKRERAAHKLRSARAAMQSALAPGARPLRI